MDIFTKVLITLGKNLTPDEMAAFAERLYVEDLDFVELVSTVAFASRPDKLDLLTNDFDAQLEHMQTPEWRAAMERAFGASAEEMGAAAIAGAKKRKETSRNRTREWVESVYQNPKELAKYSGKHVAVDSVLGIIDADESADALYNRIKAQGRLGDVVFDTIL